MAAAAVYNYLFQQFDYNLKYNYPLFDELRLKNPAAYSEWYRRKYAQQYGTGPNSLVTGPLTSTRGSITSEVDRASVHSGRSSVNEEHPSMLANHSAITQQIRGLTTGLEQSNYDYNVFQVGFQIVFSLFIWLLTGIVMG